MIHTWISKLLRDAAFTCQPRELLCSVRIKWLILVDFAIWTVIVLKQVLLNVWVPWEVNSRVRSDTSWQLFLLVSGYHVGANPDGQQHGFSIQSSINLFPPISRIWIIALAWIFERMFAYLPPFISQILDFIYWTDLIFIFDGLTAKTWSNSDLLEICKKEFPRCAHIGFQYFSSTLFWWVTATLPV